MAKEYLVFIVGLGMFSSVAMNGLSRPSAKGEDNLDRIYRENKEAAAFARAHPDNAAPNGNEIRLERSFDGHFYADVSINNVPIHALVDTGASGIALSREDARRAGIATSAGMYDVIGEGASGAVQGEFVTIDSVSLGGTSASGMQAVVLDSGNLTLLGQSFLSRFASVEIKDDTMVLR